MDKVRTFLSKFRYVDEDAQDGILTPVSLQYKNNPKCYVLKPRNEIEKSLRSYVEKAVSHQVGCWINLYAVDEKAAWRMPYPERIEHYGAMAKKAVCDDCMKEFFRENWVTFAGREQILKGQKAFNRICRDDVDWRELLEDDEFLDDVMERVKSRKIGLNDFDTFVGGCHCKRRCARPRTHSMHVHV